MSDDQDDAQKTEEPTQKKLEDSHKKGDVAKSQEINHWFMILGATLSVMIFSGYMFSSMRKTLQIFLDSPHDIPMDIAHLLQVVQGIATDVAIVLGPMLAMLVVLSVLGNLVQHKPVITLEKMKPQLNKISIVKGAKKRFSGDALVDFLKGLLKLSIVGTIAVILVVPQLDQLPLVVEYQLIDVLALLKNLSLRLLLGAVAVLAVIAGLDMLYQQYKHRKSLRMSKQDIKEEHKQAEGDPAIKQRLRAIRMERARRRMMAAVPEADVVITNPTHFAVALRYDPDTMAAPRVSAKGQDHLALRIRTLAEEHKVPIVENPPLARALHAGTEIDQEIPVEHYKAVAEVIGYVMRLKGQVARRAAPSAGAR